MSTIPRNQNEVLAPEAESILGSYLERLRQSIVAEARKGRDADRLDAEEPSPLEILKVIDARQVPDLTGRLDVTMQPDAPCNLTSPNWRVRG